MKNFSTEIKVGSVAVLVIILFIWLFSFLKGRNLLNSSDNYTIYYNNIAGLNESSPVEMNGLKIGVVSNVELVNDGSGLIKVSISVDKGILIDENSRAVITNATLIAGMKIDLLQGESDNYLENNAIIKGELAVSLIDKLDNGIDPVLLKTALLLESLDTISTKINSILNQEFNNNLGSAVSNIDKASEEFALTISENRSQLNELLSNLNSVSRVINTNSSEIDSSFKNINRISAALSRAELDTAITDFIQTLHESRNLLYSINNGEGSAGKLLKDDSLYINLNKSLESLNLLIKDMEENPGRYVQFSVFGNKKK